MLRGITFPLEDIHLYAADAELALVSTHAKTAYELIELADRMLFIYRLDKILEQQFGHTSISSRILCEQLQIPRRHFQTPDDVLGEIVAGYRRAGLHDHQIRRKLMGSTQILPTFQQAMIRQLDQLPHPT